MQGSLNQPPVVVRASRARAVLLVLGSAIFVAGGLFLPPSTESSIPRILAVGFFGLCGAVGLGMLIAPARLEFGPSGIVQKVFWRTSRFAWSDVYDFRPTTIGLANKMIGFNYLRSPAKGSGLRSLNTALVGAQATLQPGWEMDAQALADMLNAGRERWLSASQADVRPDARAVSPTFAGALTGSRINRRTYWLITAGVFAVAIGASFVPGLQRGMGPLTTILFVRIFAARLHDFGRSGWWQLVLYAIQLPALILLAVAAQQPADVVVGAAVIIQLIFTAVIGVVPGDPGPNRFGDSPTAPSPAAASETFR